jgi:RsiW-degrading membrane proteinase PrsW (M82 family)
MVEQLTGTTGPSTGTASGPGPMSRWHFLRAPWFLILVAGIAVWVICALVTAVTHDQILVPSVILVGSFVAPVAVVTFALGRLEGGHLTSEVIFVGFIAGGTLGVVGAAFLETYLLPSSTGTFLCVGLIEELCKGLVLVAVGLMVRVRQPHDGLVLGAIVGAGFAAFESSGYAFSTLIKHSGDHAIADVMSTEMTRAVFAPFAHITWTALFGGAVFASVRNGRFHLLSRSVVLTFIGVTLLHAAWDSSTGWAIMITKGVLDGNWVIDWPNTEEWIGLPSGNELAVWNVIYDAFLILNSIIGVSWLVHQWRKHTGSLAVEPAVP